MSHLSYSFCMSMLHSLWQGCLLFIVYILLERIVQNNISPLQKRNGLFLLLAAQLVFFISTFLIYYLPIENTVTAGLLGNAVSGVLPAATISLVTPWLFGIYLAIVSYKIIKAVYEWLYFKKSFHAGLQKPAIDLKLFTTQKANHFGIKRKVQLWLSNTINAPVTFGFFKPIIVLPVALVNQLSIQQAETLILHELTHIKANDYLFNWTLIIVENVFFFNPFVIALCKKIRLEREKFCDSTVIAFNYSPLLYAETLLQVQQVQQFIPQYQLAAVTGKKQLLQRIQFFTSKKNFTHKKNNQLVFPLAGVLFLLVFAATLFFQYQITATVPPASADNSVAAAYNNTSQVENTPTFVNNIIQQLSNETLNKIETAVAKQQPVIEKQLKKLQPVIKTVTKQAIAFAQQFENNFVIPAALKEGTPTKQIIVKEEQSGSKNAIVKAYTLAYINDKWVIIPQWMLTAKELSEDSLHTIEPGDSCALINEQQ